MHCSNGYLKHLWLPAFIIAIPRAITKLERYLHRTADPPKFFRRTGLIANS